MAEFTALAVLVALMNVTGTIDSGPVQDDESDFTSEVMSMISGSCSRSKVDDRNVVPALELGCETFELNAGCRIGTCCEEWGSGHVDEGAETTSTGRLSDRLRIVLL